MPMPAIPSKCFFPVFLRLLRGRLPLALMPLVSVLLFATFALSLSPGMPVAAAGLPTNLHVVGNRLVDGSGQTVRLLGVNRSGTEYACVQGWGFFDGPSDAASVQAITAWRANAVRVPLNEACWLGINGVSKTYGGANYQAAIRNYVNTLTQQGLIPILELHWSAPGTQAATGQQPMPDRDHTPTFWAQVATAYKGDSSVIFDLFNEPYPDNNQDTAEAWRCWRDGGTCSGVPFQAAGMQELVNAVRATGAQNVIMLGGVQYANALSGWLAHKPTDPTGNLVAAWHVYNFNICNNTTCYDQKVAPVAQQVPLVAGEIGENTCGHTFIDPLMGWLDARGASYLAWTWNTWGGCGPVLITDYNGTPTAYGAGFRDHLLAIAPAPAEGEFTDVPPSNAFYENIKCLVSKDVLGGYNTAERCPETGAPCFRPADNITRGQMAKVVSNAAGFSEAHSSQTFTDVPTSHTFYLFIERLASRNIVSGYNDPARCPSGQAPCFLPGALVTRGQMAKFVSEGASFTEGVPPNRRTFADVPSTNTFWLFIERLAGRDVVSGYQCGTSSEPCDNQSRPYFRPGAPVTRGQASKFVSLAFFPNCQTPAKQVPVNQIPAKK